MKIFHFPLFLIFFLTACGGGGGGSEGNGNSGTTQALNFPLETITVSANDEPIATQIATSGQSTLAISYTSSNPAVAMVDESTGVVTIIGAGETTITATGEVDAQATKASYVLTVAQPASAFSFPLEMFEVNFADPPIATQIATGGQSTGSVSYASGDTAVATVDAMTGVVTMTGSGSLIITATRAGDARYEAIKASYRLTVARATDTLNFPLETMMVLAMDEPIATQVATSGASAGAISYRSSNLAVATVDAMTGVVTILKAGETIIIATRAGDAQYEAAEASYRLTVARATDTLNFPLKAMMVLAIDEPITSQIATGGQSTRTIVYTSGNRAVATVDEVTGVVTLVGAGITTITATRAGDARYEVTEASYTLTVARVATDTLAFPSDALFASADHGLIRTQIATGGQSTRTIIYTSDDETIARVNARTGVVALIGAGETTITATRARNARYEVAEASYTLTVTRATDTLAFPLKTMMASADAEPITTQIATSDSGTEAISYRSSNRAVATVDASTGIITILKAGETIITATRARDARYEPATATYRLTVTRATNTLTFPLKMMLASVDAEQPITTQIATSEHSTGAITYRSSNVAIATVDTSTGVATIVGEGTVIITATQATDASHKTATAHYSLTVGTILNIQSSGRGTKVCTTNTYASGLIEEICESVGLEYYLLRDCDGDGLQQTRVLRRTVSRNSGGSRQEFCVPTNKLYPDLPPPDPEELAMRLQEAISFSPVYIDDHGAIIETSESSGGTRSSTTNRYASGLVEVIDTLEDTESQEGLDYNDDGDLDDFFHSRTVTRDDYKYSQHLRILTGRGGTVVEDLGEKFTNAPRRINLPEDIPDLLRFSGDIENIVIHVSPTSLGPHYVKIDSNDPSVQLLVQKTTDTQYAGRLTQLLRHDYFAEAPLIETKANTFYAIYAVKGDLYQAVLDQYPNFYVRYDLVNTLLHPLLKKTLDFTRNIVVNADIPEFLDYYDKVRIEFTPRLGTSYYSGTILINRIWGGSPRTFIHEVSHGYHHNFLSNGFNNQEIIDLYAMVPSDKSMQYGDERNTYWRTNQLEFFAQALTTWTHLESGLVFQNFDPISHVDSTFYYAHLKPWLDNHFDKED